MKSHDDVLNMSEWLLAEVIKKENTIKWLESLQLNQYEAYTWLENRSIVFIFLLNDIFSHIQGSIHGWGFFLESAETCR